MKIHLRWNGAYADVKITESGAMIDLGMLDAKERADFCDALQDVIDEIHKRDGVGKSSAQEKP